MVQLHPEFLLDGSKPRFTSGPEVTTLADGTFAITYLNSTLHHYYYTYKVAVRYVDEHGNRVGTPERILGPNLTDSGAYEIGAIGAEGFFVGARVFDGFVNFDDYIWIYPTGIGGTVVPLEYETHIQGRGPHEFPDFVTAPNGDIVFLQWVEGQPGSDAEFILNRFDTSGALSSVTVPTNTTVNYRYANAALTTLSDGSFLITWQSHDPSGTELGIYAMNVGVDGIPLGDASRVVAPPSTSDTSTSLQEILALPGGGSVLFYNSYSRSSGEEGIYGQNVDDTGSPVGDPFKISLDEIGGEMEVALLPNGQFVVVWTEDELDGDEYGVFGRIFDQTGEPDGEVFQVNTIVAGDQRSPSVAANEDGSFLVTWHSSRNGYSTNAYARFFDENTILSGPGDELLIGQDASDVLYGFAGDDTLDGQDGDDKLNGGPGRDEIDGGAGDDLLFGLTGNDVIFGNDGSDSIYSGDGNDTVDGGAGDDYLQVGKGRNIVFGQSGDDTLVGRTGFDVLLGGEGADFLTGGNRSSDRLFGGAGNDTLEGGGGSWDGGFDRLHGGDGDDLLRSSYGNNSIQGANGSDTLIGGQGDDTLLGGIGEDWLSYEDSYAAVQVDLSDQTQNGGWAENDVIASIEIVSATRFDDALTGNEFRNVFYGDEGSDTLIGLGGTDKLNGGSGDDRLFGGNGNDRLIGGTGNDSMTGGAGADTFVFAAGDGADQITDFAAAEDVLHFSAGTTVTVTDNGTDTTISYGSDSVVLEGVVLAQGDITFEFV